MRSLLLLALGAVAALGGADAASYDVPDNENSPTYKKLRCSGCQVAVMEARHALLKTEARMKKWKKPFGDQAVFDTFEELSKRIINEVRRGGHLRGTTCFPC